MREVTYCAVCGSFNLGYMGEDKWYCNECEKVVPTKDRFIMSPYERTRSAVYATGNRWAIENFNATH